jgi:5-methyltetrahydropteroyltriglutamate--homocysteine methyltransferase
MVRTHILGYPRIGAHRELKFALEAFWRNEADEAHLERVAAELKRERWQVQRDAGLACIAAGDFSLYDPMLSQSTLLGALPERFGFDASRLTLAQSFELARGNAQQPAMEMTKWFDTNYHYLVPEVGPTTRFGRGADDYFREVLEARSLGTPVKPVLVGPVTWLHLAKSHVAGFDRLSMLPALVRAFADILRRLGKSGIEWVQLDEPVLGLELEPRWLAALDAAYEEIARLLAGAGPKLLLATYFESAAEHAARLVQLPVHGYHIDLVRAPHQLTAWRAALPADKVLSVGVIDGRNVWRTDLERALQSLQPLHAELGDRLWVAPSCSLAHVPVSLAHERKLDAGVRSWLAFAEEKLGELRTLARALNEGEAAVASELAESAKAAASRRHSKRVHNALVQRRLAAVTPAMSQRRSPFAQRIAAQRAALNLPPLPTTTIGSFPQTSAIRQARAAFKRCEIGALDYLHRMRAEIQLVVGKQTALGLDVLLHGEPERNDMVEYFGEQLWGYAFTESGWVQSYGSRCVKPPIIYGDVYRPSPMTVETARYAQSLTDKPMKGMLTGPVTMLQWSFVRDDQPREATAMQLALAIREEVVDLEQAGIRIIQIDEPAFREGLPLKQRDWKYYLDWAVRAFKLAACPVQDETQIHTHMCYSEFNDILPSIAEMDADVITIETSRSAMELLDGFGVFRYPNEIGPGVYDIHSPRVPSVDSMVKLLERACAVIPAERLWVNPDCGLKTRGWPETEQALRHLVQAAQVMRERLQLCDAEASASAAVP